MYHKVDERTRAEMFKLRQTWNDVFPQKKLYAIDVQINLLDPAWPVTAKPPSNSIHFNPKFLKTTVSYIIFCFIYFFNIDVFRLVHQNQNWKLMSRPKS